MNETNRETRLPSLRHDYCGTRIRQAQFRYRYDWRWEYVELLQGREYEQAAQFRDKQEKQRWKH